MKHFALLFCLLPLESASATAAEELTARQQNIVVIASLAAKGDVENLKTALRRGLDEGLTVGEIKEVLVQLYAYCGFPRSLNALGAFMAVVDERADSGIHDEPGREPAPLPDGFSAWDAGREVQTELAGRPVEGGVFDFAPVINDYLRAHLFGDIFARDNLDYPSRELATVGMLASIEGLEPQLASHVAVCLNVGLTPEQLRCYAATLRERVGRTEGDRAAHVLDEVLRDR
ncbi:MAG: carboxymuconolactone decarboxylase family protein [Alistipes sp.]|nr:carboxymuconolactone decarboxylase family protein [Alistipes sp.]